MTMEFHLNPPTEKEFRESLRAAMIRAERKAKRKIEAAWICGSILFGLGVGYAMSFITRLLYR